MPNQEQLELLLQGVAPWNKWRDQNPDLRPDLKNAKLSNLNLRKANLRSVDLSESDLGGARLAAADLSGAVMRGTILTSANLDDAKLTGTDLRNATLTKASLGRASLTGANLKGAHLLSALAPKSVWSKANMSGSLLTAANLSQSDLSYANLSGATFSQADLQASNLCGANMRKTKFLEANLARADASDADLTGADLRQADAYGTKFVGSHLVGVQAYKINLFGANLRGANLSRTDLRSGTLQWAKLDGATITGSSLWETQRANWSIKGIICVDAFWDSGSQSMTKYLPGEFERLYSEQSVIEFIYEGGVSTFELSTLPALLYHLSSLHSGVEIRLKSIEEVGGGAKISLSVGDADDATTDLVRADALKIYEAQLSLRNNELLRLQIEKDTVQGMYDKLIQSLLESRPNQNIFNAPVYGPLLPSGNSNVVVNQTLNDNSALLELLSTMARNIGDLNSACANTSELEGEINRAEKELRTHTPNRSARSTVRSTSAPWRATTAAFSLCSSRRTRR